MHGKNWSDYFGSFSGRAHVFFRACNVNVNTATILQLQTIGISQKDANDIKKRKYDNNEELDRELTRLKIDQSIIGKLVA